MTDDTRIPGEPNEPVEVEAIPVDEVDEEAAGPKIDQCHQCQRDLLENTRIDTGNAAFCPDCYRELKRVLEESLSSQSQGINYPFAVLGGLVGGLLGSVVWWGFTVLTGVMFGLVAVLIGFAVGKGVVILSGNKRSGALQGISVVLTAVFFLLSSYWVNRTGIMEFYSSQDQIVSLPIFPTPDVLINVLSAGFEFFDLIFLAIALWQAFKIPAPVKLNTEG